MPNARLELARRLARFARTFRAPLTLERARSRRGEGTVVLRTWRGPSIEVRLNRYDALIVTEIFVDRPYNRTLSLPDRPTVVDIGGYIGDFVVYAAGWLGARVVVYEPTRENFEVLTRNVARNGMEDRVTAVNEAVGAGGTLTLNVEVDGSEVHASVYKHAGAPTREVPCATLDEVLERHGLERVDLLKVDCEGGEYGLFEAASDEALARVDAIALEVHAVGEQTEAAQGALRARLVDAGFDVPPLTGRTEVLVLQRASRPVAPEPVRG